MQCHVVCVVSLSCTALKQATISKSEHEAVIKELLSKHTAELEKLKQADGKEMANQWLTVVHSFASFMSIHSCQARAPEND